MRTTTVLVLVNLIFLSKLAAQASRQAEVNTAALNSLPNSTTENQTNSGEKLLSPGDETVLQTNETNTMPSTAVTDSAVVEEEEQETTTTTITTTLEPETTPMEEPIYDDLTFNATVEPNGKYLTQCLYFNFIFCRIM